MKEIGINIEFFKKDLVQAIDSGIYQISIHKNNKSGVVYIGESVHVLKRCGEHLYNLKQDPTYFGLTEEIIKDSKITLKFELLEKLKDNRLMYKRQLELIKDKNPLSQNGVKDNQKTSEDKVFAIREFLKYASA